MFGYLKTSAGSVNVRDYGGDGHLIVLVHGLGGSAVNWEAVGPRIAKVGRTVAIDLPGFGLSPPGPDWELTTHARALRAALEELGSPATLIGNSMGALIAEMVASRHPVLVSSLALIAPATPPRLPDPHLHWPTARRLLIQATPGLGRAVTRYFLQTHTPEELVRFSLGSIAHAPARVPVHVVEEHVRLTEARMFLPWTEEAVPSTGRSVAKTFARPGQFVEMVRDIQAPTLVIQGIGDHIVSPTAVEWLCSVRPEWELVQMEDTGHIPMLDAPVRFLGILMPWLEKVLEHGTTERKSAV